MLFVVQDRRVPSWVGNGNRVLAAGERKARRRKGQEEQGERDHTHARADVRGEPWRARVLQRAGRQDPRDKGSGRRSSLGKQYRRKTPSPFKSADKKPYSSSPASKTFPRVFDVVFHIWNRSKPSTRFPELLDRIHKDYHSMFPYPKSSNGGVKVSSRTCTHNMNQTNASQPICSKSRNSNSCFSLLCNSSRPLCCLTARIRCSSLYGPLGYTKSSHSQRQQERSLDIIVLEKESHGCKRESRPLSPLSTLFPH